MVGILACGEARRHNERGELVPSRLKIVVVLEELGETHTAGSEDHRVDAAALRAVGHGHGGAHHRKTTGSSRRPRVPLRGRSVNTAGREPRLPRDEPAAQDATTMTAPSTRRGAIPGC